MIKNLFEKFKIALFTKRCKVCGEVVCFDEEFCNDCCSLPEINAPICKKCGCFKDDCICHKFQKEIEYKAIVAPYYYEKSISKAIVNMKMHDMLGLIDYLGHCVSDSINKHYSDVHFDYVTYIPMIKSDIVKRGYNQAELIAKIVSDECNIPMYNFLFKKYKTKMQKRQKASERFANMHNAFDLVSNADVDNKTILLVDDVKTTGATLNTAALVLKAYGAKAVYCAVIAIVR